MAALCGSPKNQVILNAKQAVFLVRFCALLGQVLCKVPGHICNKSSIWPEFYSNFDVRFIIFLSYAFKPVDVPFEQ